MCGATGVLILSAALAWFAVSGKARHAPSVNPATTTVIAVDTSTSTQQVPRALDGVFVDTGTESLQTFAVVIDAHPDSRPTSGLAHARLIFTLPVESGATRYLAVFDASSTVDQVGPVRSARPYSVEFANGLDATFVHVGGSPEALDAIKRLSGFRDLNQYWNGKFFWRSQKRLSPHNVYTRSDLLIEAARTKKFSAGQFTLWRFKDEEPLERTEGSPGRGAGDAPPDLFSGPYTVAWTYDGLHNRYLRHLAGEQQKDLDGESIFAKNVVVLTTDVRVIDSEGRLYMRTTGKGHATLYRDGRSYPVTWRRTAGKHIQFESVDGTEAMFNRGTTWIEIVTT